MLQEFKKFILRGNVIDLAVGVVMGSAFGAIVTSLVNNIIMPVIGYLTAGIDFSDLKIVLAAARGDTPEVAIGYGVLIQVIIQFLIISLCIFFVVKGINTLTEKLDRKKEAEEAAAAPPAKPDDIALLEEIRDLLKKQQAS